MIVRHLTLLSACMFPALLLGNLSFSKSDIESFSQEAQKKYGIEAPYVVKTLKNAKPIARVIELMNKPYEAKPWHTYQKIFLTPEKVKLGKAFLKKHKTYFDKAERKYQVPREVIAAIIGVETHYGRVTGHFPVLDTLATLAFLYPKRAPFFRKELAQFIKLSDEQHLHAAQVKGSYAGAIGLPQFMPSSYRHYAVDFDNNGKTRLLTSAPDAIGSVANYLKEHGWKANQLVAVPALSPSQDPNQLWDDNIAKPKHSAKALRNKSLVFDSQISPDTKVNLVQMQNHDNIDLWITMDNFYAISRYNHSKRYALVVHLLSERLKLH